MDGSPPGLPLSPHKVILCTVLLLFHLFLLASIILEKEMATHSSVLAWRIPGTGEPGGLPSMGSHRVGHDWSDLAAALQQHSFTVIYISIGFPGGSVVKNLPAKQETRVRFLGREDPPEKEMATHSSILAWKIPQTEEAGGLYGVAKSWLSN